jgi:hypothetical protein
MAMGTRSCPAGVESWTSGGGAGEEKRVPIVVLQMVWWSFEDCVSRVRGVLGCFDQKAVDDISEVTGR